VYNLLREEQDYLLGWLLAATGGGVEVVISQPVAEGARSVSHGSSNLKFRTLG
jgi:hypothetical protein